MNPVTSAFAVEISFVQYSQF